MFVAANFMALAAADRRAALEWVRTRRRAHSEQLGFIPLAGVERLANEGNLIIARNHEGPIGFILLGGSKTTCRIFQLLVEPRWRRHYVGWTLLRRAEAWARKFGYQQIEARVAETNECDGFWLACGFSKNEIGPGGGRRGRVVSTFQKQVG